MQLHSKQDKLQNGFYLYDQSGGNFEMEKSLPTIFKLYNIKEYVYNFQSYTGTAEWLRRIGKETPKV